MRQTSKLTEQVAQSATRGIVRPVLVSAVFFMVVTGIAYPLVTTGFAKAVLS